MKMKNLCLTVLAAYSCVGINAIHGAQSGRFMNTLTAVKVAALQAFKNNTHVQHAFEKAKIVTHKTTTTLSCYRFLESRIPVYYPKGRATDPLSITEKIKVPFALHGIQGPEIDGLLSAKERTNIENQLSLFQRKRQDTDSIRTPYDLVLLFNDTHQHFSPEDKDRIARALLEKAPGFSTASLLLDLVSSQASRAQYVEQLINTNQFEKSDYELWSIGSGALKDVFDCLSEIDRNRLIMKLLERSLNLSTILSPKVIVHLLTKSTSTKDKEQYIQYLFEKKNDSLFLFPISEILATLPPEQRAPFVAIFLEKGFDSLHHNAIPYLISTLTDQEVIVHYATRWIEQRKTAALQTSEQGSSSRCCSTKALTTLFKTLSPAQKSSYASAFLNFPLETLDYSTLTHLISHLASETEKIDAIKRCIEARKFCWEDPAVLLSHIQASVSQEEQAPFALRILDQLFSFFLANSCEGIALHLIEQLPHVTKMIYRQQFLAHENIKTLSPMRTYTLLRLLPKEKRAEIATAFLETSFDSLPEESIEKFIDELKDHEKLKWLRSLLESDKATTRFLNCDSFRSLKPEDKAPLAHYFLEKNFDSLSVPTQMDALSYLPEPLTFEWLKKIAQHDVFTSASTLATTAKGPLFSNFTLKHYGKISQSKRMQNPGSKNLEPLRHVLLSAARFTEQEYKKGNIVLFHGQHDQWAFLRDIFDMLGYLAEGKEPSKQHVPVRFQREPVLSSEEVIELRANGVVNYDKHRFKVLFVNLDYNANGYGSNSALYVYSNMDQSAGSRFTRKTGIRNQFIAFGLEKEYQELLTEDPTVFDRLYDLYKKDVVARGNMGRLLAFSLPPQCARELCYPTISGGRIHPAKINSYSTTDIVTISQNFGETTDHNNEYGLILDKRVTHAQAAKEAEVIIEGFTTAPTAESKQYEQAYRHERENLKNRLLELLAHKETISATGYFL